jgi:hypothetical protein
MAQLPTTKRIGRAGPDDDDELLRWAPRSPDPTTCDFVLRSRITAAIAAIDHGMLQRVWEELDYRLDVCRVTKGAHIEHLCCTEAELREFRFPSVPISRV